MKKARSLGSCIMAALGPWLIVTSFIGLGAQVSFAKEPEHCLVEVRFELGRKAEGPLSGVLRFRPSDDESWRTVDVKGRAAEASFEVGKTWVIEASIPGFWAPLQGINVHEPCSRRMHFMPVWPIGTLTGELTVDGRKSGLPEELEARIRSAPGEASGGALRSSARSDGAEVAGRVHCPVDKEAAVWSCDVPADHLDIAFSSADLAPIRRHDLKVDAGKKSAVAPLRFRTGASVAGYVEIEDGDISSRCRARLASMEMGPTSLPGRAQRRSHSVTVDERGFFQLAGLSTGTYVLEVEQPGYATQKVFPLDLFEGREIFLRESIVLRKPLDIEVRISPPLDWAESPWQVSVMRASSQSAQFEDAPVFDEPADRTGYALIAQQPPGRYTLTVSDTLGNPFHTEWILEINDASDAQIDIELDLVEVDGQLSLGDEPISGEVFFGGVYGARAVRLLVGDDGKFQGTLPEEGTWEVDIRGETPKLETTVEVEVEVGPSGRAILDVELPDTQVFGRVVDSSGQIVEGATVRLSTELGTISAMSDERGEFELLAVPAKVAWLSAKAESLSGQLTSESVGVSINEGQPAGPMELRLIENRSIAGRVVGPQGPIPGAVVRLYPSVSTMAISRRVKTDINGKFQAELPEQAKQLVALISGPGHALKIVEFEVPAADEEVQLSVPTNGGVLEIFTPAAARTWRLDVLQSGRLIGFQSLMDWSLAHGAEFRLDEDRNAHMTVPQLAAGDYRVCLRPARAEDYGPATDPPGAILEQLRARGQCFSGYLGEGGRLSYRFDTGLSEGS